MRLIQSEYALILLTIPYGSSLILIKIFSRVERDVCNAKDQLIHTQCESRESSRDALLFEQKNRGKILTAFIKTIIFFEIKKFNLQYFWTMSQFFKNQINVYLITWKFNRHVSEEETYYRTQELSRNSNKKVCQGSRVRICDNNRI